MKFNLYRNSLYFHLCGIFPHKWNSIYLSFFLWFFFLPPLSFYSHFFLPHFFFNFFDDFFYTPTFFSRIIFFYPHFFFNFLDEFFNTPTFFSRIIFFTPNFFSTFLIFLYPHFFFEILQKKSWGRWREEGRAALFLRLDREAI